MKNYGVVIVYFFSMPILVGMEINSPAPDAIPTIQCVNNRFYCIECDYSFKDKHNAIQHLITMHLLTGSFLCPHCEHYIQRFTQLRTHHKQEAGVIDNCLCCYKIYKTDLPHWTAISRTARLLLDEKISSIVACAQIESFLNNMITWTPSPKKTREHAKLDFIQCIECKRNYRRSTLRKHIRDHIIKQEFPCGHVACQKTYAYYRLTCHHKNVHDGPRKSCTNVVCQKTAAEQKALWQKLLDDNEPLINKKMEESIELTTLMRPKANETEETTLTDQEYDELARYLTMDH